MRDVFGKPEAKTECEAEGHAPIVAMQFKTWIGPPHCYVCARCKKELVLTERT